MYGYTWIVIKIFPKTCAIQNIYDFLNIKKNTRNVLKSLTQSIFNARRLFSRFLRETLAKLRRH